MERNTTANDVKMNTGFNLCKFFVREVGRYIIYYGPELEKHIDRVVKAMNAQEKHTERHRIEEYIKKINTLVFEMANNSAVFNFEGMEEFSDIAEADFIQRLKDGVWLTWFKSHNFWCSRKKELMDEFGLKCDDISGFFNEIHPQPL